MADEKAPSKAEPPKQSTDIYFFPDLGVSVEAESSEKALELAQKQVKKDQTNG